MVAAALRRELAGTDPRGGSGGSDPGADAGSGSAPYRHRIPLGLLMLSRGSITREQLTTALAAQRGAGQGRLGEWLIETGRISQSAVANALAAQWGVPVLALDGQPQVKTMRLLPRFFVEMSGVVPLRVAGGKILYIAVDEQVDRCSNHAIAMMTGYRVEAGVMRGTDYSSLCRSVLDDGGTRVRIFNPVPIDRMAECVTDVIAGSGAASARLVRFRDYIWVRMEDWPVRPGGSARSPAASLPGHGTEIEDAIFTLATHCE